MTRGARLRRLGRAGRAVAAWLVVFALMLPFVWMVLGSFKSARDFLSYPPVWLFRPTLDNYAEVFADNAFPRYVLNSTIVAAGATAIGLVLGVPAAHALARWRRNAIGVVLLAARMAPGIAFLIPLFVACLELHLVGGYTSLIASHLIFTLPLAVWMMVGFIEAVPVELEQAALIDGCSVLGALLRIVVPLTRQGIAATAILAFIASWNNFLFALVLSNDATKTLPVAVLGYIGYNSIQWGPLMAAASVITLPVMVLALCVQRYIVRGLVSGAVTG
ncbi:MAG: carbohydrate ABC transporter permease [Alphaproteobacteria bacterium]|nr:carbohydrate ABC transporter permease [Alphaproteobacteria bacterium]